MEFFTATKCGQLAFEVTQSSGSGKVIGNTSRGVFLRISTNRIVYLSSELFGNPLNINILPFPVPFQEIQINEKIQFGGEKIIFPRPNFGISVTPEIIYKPTPRPPLDKEPERQMERILAILNEFNHDYEPEGFITSLPGLLNFGEARFKSNNQLHELQIVTEHLKTGNISKLQKSLSQFIGSGRGLTPAGDDLICGFLLAVNRWGLGTFQSDNLADLNAKVSQEAYRRTTTLSANLIELATKGEGDERLLIALDSIFTGNSPPRKSAKLLLSYGSSSGLDAFTGMVIALI